MLGTWEIAVLVGEVAVIELIVVAIVINRRA